MASKCVFFASFCTQIEFSGRLVQTFEFLRGTLIFFFSFLTYTRGYNPLYVRQDLLAAVPTSTVDN